ncbi:MAG: pilus assembly protein [Planctomycetia bacterium]|nr:pilus assembly protein [Planctomycetia bacterium]
MQLSDRTTSPRRRRGLAPLEFVLWLPVLLFVMALMVNYGTIATWRVRSEIVSQHAAWRTRWPRNPAMR